jgi:predicted GNAT family acetyltransferase
MFVTPPELPAVVRPLIQRFILQMTGPETPPDLLSAPEGLVRLGLEDGPDMVALAALTEPGPMGLHTVTMGNWWGVRRQGRLVAMAGQRMHLKGLVEVSGVCTHPDVRGEGLARKLIVQVLHDIASRGENSFLHLKTENAAALGLYQGLGFKVRTEIQMSVIEAARGG